MGGVQFSAALAGPIKRIDFWGCAIRRKRKLKVRPKLWARKKAAAGITGPTGHLTVDEMLQKLKEARTEYREIKKKDREERLKFLDTLAPKDRDRLKRDEEARQLARTSKKINGKLESSAVSMVQIEGQECTDQKKIETTLLHVNCEKIHASENTSFMQTPLKEEFGDTADTPAAAAVLDGSYEPPPGTDDFAAQLLEELKVAELPPGSTSYEPHTRISTDEHIRGWKRAKERTSAGLSDLHFGMFKAHIKRRNLADIDASMRSVAYSTGYSFKRWKKGLDVQLLKRSRDHRAEKLRTILLLEADFNMNNKMLGRDAMLSASRRKVLARDNYGGRKGHRAAEVSLNSYLTYNSIWGRRGRAVVMSNDAKGCYDRIAHVVLALALLRLKIPKTAIQSMLDAIQHMDHYVCTAFGVSEDKYGNDPTRPKPQGVLQGNGAGPAAWSAIVSALISVMRKRG